VLSGRYKNILFNADASATHFFFKKKIKKKKTFFEKHDSSVEVFIDKPVKI